MLVDGLISGFCLPVGKLGEAITNAALKSNLAHTPANWRRYATCLDQVAHAEGLFNLNKTNRVKHGFDK